MVDEILQPVLAGGTYPLQLGSEPVGATPSVVVVVVLLLLHVLLLVLLLVGGVGGGGGERCSWRGGWRGDDEREGWRCWSSCSAALRSEDARCDGDGGGLLCE